MKANNDTGFTLIELLIVVAIIGIIAAVIVAQSDRPLVFARVCNIEPGQKEAAAAVAAEMATLVNERFPEVEMTARTGRWINALQSLAAPVDQLRLTEQHADVESRDALTMILMGEDELAALQRKLADVVDVGTCLETQYQAQP